MLVPIRCFSCGSVIANKYYDFMKKVSSGGDPSKVLDELGVKRYCCRRMILSTVEYIDSILGYYEAMKRYRESNL